MSYVNPPPAVTPPNTITPMGNWTVQSADGGSYALTEPPNGGITIGATAVSVAPTFEVGILQEQGHITVLSTAAKDQKQYPTD